MIKSTLSSLPTYYLSLIPIPISVARRIEKLHRDFLWGGLGDEHKYHLANWKHICDSIRYGGLGIRNVVGFNKALLGKWLWRYAMEREALWLKVIDAKYGSMGGVGAQMHRGPYGDSLWKSIRAGWDCFSSFISYSVGDGSRIKFWHGIWCGGQPLKDQFPE